MTGRLRYFELWGALVTLLSTARMLTVLQGGKVYREGTDYSAPEGTEDKVWGRLVLVPTGRIWQDPVGVGPTRTLSFLTRGEVHSNNNAAYYPQQTLEAIQDEAHLTLDGYVIPRLTHVMGALPIFLARPPQELPLWDDTRGLWYTSAEWRCELAP